MVVGLMALALAGCQANREKVDVAIGASIDDVRTACEVTTIAYALFEAAGSDKVKPAVLAKIRGGYAAISAVCAAPPTNTAESIGAVLKAVYAFRTEVEAAKP